MSIDTLRLKHDRRMVMVVLGLVLIPAIWYVRTDFALYADNWPLLRARLLVRSFMVAIPIVGLFLVRSLGTRKEYSRVVFGVALGTAAVIVAINVLRPFGSTMPLRSPLFHLAVMYGALPNTFGRQVLPPLLLSAGLIALRLTWLTGGQGGDIAGDVLILLVLNVVGVVLVRRRLALERDVTHAWSAEREARVASDRAVLDVRTLRGLIPICAHCKRVRTDVGDWQQIERYVREHSEAEFSHGVCPECMRENYGEFAIEPVPG